MNNLREDETLTLSLLRVINFKFSPRNFTRNVTSHCMKNMVFHSLLTRLKDDYTTNSQSTALIHFALKGWENVLFELRSDRVKHRENGPPNELWQQHIHQNN